MWELDCEESWAPKNWCFWTVVLEKTLESPLDSKEIKPVQPKGYQSWVFIGKTEAEAKTPILWPPNAKNWLTGNDPDAGNDWRQEEKGTSEDEMFGWHHWLDGHEFEQAPGDVKDREAWHAAVHGMKEESGKVDLKLNIQKTKIMASGPITSWQIEGETVEAVTDFIFLGSQITADGDCSHKIKDTCSMEEKLWQT